jgi:CNT family concentrative nucleoside transporter
MSTSGAHMTGPNVGNLDDLPPVASATGTNASDKVVQRTTSGSSYSQEKGPADAEKGVAEPPIYGHRADEESQTRHAFWAQYKPFSLAIVAAIILGWWISSTILKATRHRW